MKLKDEVSWTSGAAGATKTKQGKIIAVVPAGKAPVDCLDTTMDAVFEFDGNGPRNHESYLVLVDRGEGKKPSLYWPVVSKLELVSQVWEPPREEEEVNDKQLPGIPPPGSLHNAVKRFVTQRLKIEDERMKLKALGDEILKAMEQEKKSALSIPVAGETYVFKVTTSSARLKMSRVRKEKVTA